MSEARFGLVSPHLLTHYHSPYCDRLLDRAVRPGASASGDTTIHVSAIVYPLSFPRKSAVGTARRSSTPNLVGTSTTHGSPTLYLRPYPNEVLLPLPMSSASRQPVVGTALCGSHKQGDRPYPSAPTQTAWVRSIDHYSENPTTGASPIFEGTCTHSTMSSILPASKGHTYSNPVFLCLRAWPLRC
jgi:hypothetical protein